LQGEAIPLEGRFEPAEAHLCPRGSTICIAAQDYQISNATADRQSRGLWYTPPGCFCWQIL